MLRSILEGVLAIGLMVGPIHAANTAPTITSQPANQTVNVGATATFSVAATGTGTLKYQWSKNGTSISGATSTSYTTPATVATDNGSTFRILDKISWPKLKNVPYLRYGQNRYQN